VARGTLPRLARYAASVTYLYQDKRKGLF
jgi:hypothetical protein